MAELPFLTYSTLAIRFTTVIDDICPSWDVVSTQQIYILRVKTNNYVTIVTAHYGRILNRV